MVYVIGLQLPQLVEFDAARDATASMTRMCKSNLMKTALASSHIPEARYRCIKCYGCSLPNVSAGEISSSLLTLLCKNTIEADCSHTTCQNC